jgi:hypothetical protein
MIILQRTSLLKSVIEVMKIPLDSYEDLLFVQECLAIYYSMLERSLGLSYGQHGIEWCHQFTAHQLSIIGSKPATPLYKALYKTLMDVKRKADCEQPFAPIDVMNRIARVLAMDRCAGLQKYQDIITCSYVRSNARDRRQTSAAKSARRLPCGWLALNVFTLQKNYLTTKGIEFGTSIEITTGLCNLSFMPTEYSFQTML